MAPVSSVYSYQAGPAALRIFLSASPNHFRKSWEDPPPTASARTPLAVAGGSKVALLTDSAALVPAPAAGARVAAAAEEVAAVVRGAFGSANSAVMATVVGATPVFRLSNVILSIGTLRLSANVNQRS